MGDQTTENPMQLQSSSLTLDSPSQVSHRGAINKTGQVEFQCSTEFLLALCMEFMRAQSYNMVTVVSRVSEEEQISRLKFLAHELQRLLKHTRLFPSTAICVRFCCLLGLDSRLQFQKACNALLIEAEMRKIMISSRKNETRTSFIDGSRNWENFLLDGAPGVPYNWMQTVPRSVFQIIPPVGIRIVSDFEREEAEIINFVERSQIPLDVQTARTTLLINFDNPTASEEVVPDMVLPQQAARSAIRPNPFPDNRRTRLGLTTSYAEPLELFPVFIDRLDQPPPHPPAPIPVLNAPGLFPMSTLRTWQHPTKLQDLRFLR